jgi:chemotaxis protein MotB
MARRKDGGHGGGHGWFVTFADLMGLLVSFCVMLVAFSTQDQVKLQVVAGSMRDAFGVQDRVRYSGVIEIDGLPTRPKLKSAAPIPPEEASATPGPDQRGSQEAYGANSIVIASSRWRRHRCAKPAGHQRPGWVWLGTGARCSRAPEPYDRTRRLISGWPPRSSPCRSACRSPAITPPASCRRNRLQAMGTVGRPRQRGPQDARANGVPTSQFFMVAGKADTQPLFPTTPIWQPIDA